MREAERTTRRLSAAEFASERDELWDWWLALSMGTANREQFDAEFDAELAQMQKEELHNA